MDNQNNTYICQYCNKSYATLYILKNHQKTAKFCIELQNKEIKEKNNTTSNCISEVEVDLFKCEYCNKEFTTKYNYNFHLTNCKEKKIIEDNDLRKKLVEYQNTIKEYELEKLNIIKEYELKLEFERSNVLKLEKEIESYKVLLARPINTTVYNDNSRNKTTNYNVQFNQMLEKIGILCDKAVLSRLKNIPDSEIQKYNCTDIATAISNTISDALQDLAFCTDMSRKTVVTKDEQNESVKMDVDDFLTTCLQMGRPELNNYLDNVKMSIDDKVNDDTLSEEDFNKFKPKYTEIRNFINDEQMNIKTSKKNPLKKLSSMTITKMEQLHRIPTILDKK
jgi:hypothetical protein